MLAYHSSALQLLYQLQDVTNNVKGSLHDFFISTREDDFPHLQFEQIPKSMSSTFEPRKTLKLNSLCKDSRATNISVCMAVCLFIQSSLTLKKLHKCRINGGLPTEPYLSRGGGVR